MILNDGTEPCLVFNLDLLYQPRWLDLCNKQSASQMKQLGFMPRVLLEEEETSRHSDRETSSLGAAAH